jgi:hypothetical protein
MATQRMTIATLAGKAAVTVTDRFERWRSAPESDSLDRLCVSIHENAMSLSVVYYTEWVDRWLMGYLVPGPGAVSGRRFAATCLTPAEAVDMANRCGNQFDEQEWLASRLREAAMGFGGIVRPIVVIIIREVIGASVCDDEVRIAAGIIPSWLCPPNQSFETE